MSWIVNIDNNELVDKVIRLSIDEELDNQNNQFSLQCKNIDSLYHFKESEVLYNNEKVIGGIVLEQNYSERGIKISNISCIDYNYIFQNRIVIENYTEMLLSDILIDLISKYATEFTTNSVRTCNKTIEKFSCNYIPLSEAIRKLLEYAPDYHYYIDGDKDFHLFEFSESSGPVFQAINGKHNFKRNTLKVNYDASSIVDRVWVVGNKQASTKEISQYYVGDGKQRYFTLAYEPNYTKVYLDNVLKESKLESNDDQAQDFLINKKNKVVYIPDNITTPFSGEIKVTYKPTIQIIDFFENTKSDNPYLLEKVIKNKDIVDKMAARQFGKAEIKRTSKVKVTLSFTTREHVKIGQRCYVKIDDFNIDGYYLVKKVRTNMVPSDTIRSVELEEL